MNLGAPTDSDHAARRQRLGLLLLAAGALIVVLATVLGFCAGRNAAPPASPSSTATASAPGRAATPVSGLKTVAVASLPVQARDTLALIDRGGPYPYDQDNTVFGNNEGLLPSRPRGYYREYTVVAPGTSSRGTRRLVVGAGGDIFYTDDHYDSFRQVLR